MLEHQQETPDAISSKKGLEVLRQGSQSAVREQKQASTNTRKKDRKKERKRASHPWVCPKNLDKKKNMLLSLPCTICEFLSLWAISDIHCVRALARRTAKCAYSEPCVCSVSRRGNNVTTLFHTTTAGRMLSILSHACACHQTENKDCAEWQKHKKGTERNATLCVQHRMKDTQHSLLQSRILVRTRGHWAHRVHELSSASVLSHNRQSFLTSSSAVLHWTTPCSWALTCFRSLHTLLGLLPCAPGKRLTGCQRH